MPKEIYEQRIKQLKQWLDDDTITSAELMMLMSAAIEELFVNSFNQATNNITQEQSNESQL